MGEAAGDAIAFVTTLVDAIVVIGGGLAAAHRLFLPSLVAEMRGQFRTPAGEPFNRLVQSVFDLEDPDELGTFLRGRPMELDVPGSAARCPSTPCSESVSASRVSARATRSRSARTRTHSLICPGGIDVPHRDSVADPHPGWRPGRRRAGNAHPEGLDRWRRVDRCRPRRHARDWRLSRRPPRGLLPDVPRRRDDLPEPGAPAPGLPLEQLRLQPHGPTGDRRHRRHGDAEVGGRGVGAAGVAQHRRPATCRCTLSQGSLSGFSRQQGVCRSTSASGPWTTTGSPASS